MASRMSRHVAEDPEMDAMDDSIAAIQKHPASSRLVDEPSEEATGLMTGHMMSLQDPDNPPNWPIHRRIYASAVSVAFAFVV